MPQANLVRIIDGVLAAVRTGGVRSHLGSERELAVFGECRRPSLDLRPTQRRQARWIVRRGGRCLRFTPRRQRQPARAHFPAIVPARVRPKAYSASYKARVLEEYESLDKAGKGALLRREGLYTSLISAWRQQREQGVRAALAKPVGRPPADARDRVVSTDWPS